MAGYFVSKGVDKFGFGFNFLHKEVKRISMSDSSWTSNTFHGNYWLFKVQNCFLGLVE